MEITKSVQISAQSKTSTGESIAYFTANVSDNGTNSSMTIQNQTLYEANKTQVRKDKSDFDNAVYEVEDESKTTATETANNA